MSVIPAVPAHRDEVLIAHAKAVLADMAQLASSLKTAMLLTDDGFEVARYPDVETDGRFASISSAMQALSDAVTRELAMGSTDSVIITSAVGYVIQRRVPGRSLVLAAVFDADETLGKALSVARLSAEKLSTDAT
jgi:uncharacterized protein